MLIIKEPSPIQREFTEAPTRFELVIEVLQTFALPLGYGAVSNKL